MWRLMLLAGVCVSGCQFDEGGVSFVVADAGAPGQPDAVALFDGAPPSDAAIPDGLTPDATLAPCVDEDGDTFLVVNIPGATCAGPLDCDDTDADAFPGQDSYYDHPRASGGFDYNCDGAESVITDTQGGDCRWDWWNCVGTGWVGTVPACGVVGQWHSCEESGSDCVETSSLMTKMLCR